jgi:hypothetical protein
MEHEEVVQINADNNIGTGVAPGFGNKDAWELAQRQAIALSKSTLVPKDYQGAQNIGNCLIALDMAYRIGANPMLVMQNLYVVQGRPGWSSTFLIASVNHCGRYTALRYEERGTEGDKTYAVRAWATEKASGERLNGTWITWQMVEQEGWSKKSGSKWLTMPGQMFKYRAAGFWVRTYAPEISMGLLTAEEVQDITPTKEAVQQSIRWTSKQMDECRYQIEVMGQASADEVLERNPMLVQDQRDIIATWTFQAQGA